MSDEIILQITSDLQIIADAYRDRQRHSLEAILRYLLREQTRDECLLLLRALPATFSLEFDQRTELSSSDEEDEVGHQYAGIQAPRLESSDGMLADTKAQYNVPLPNACGARWANDGRLVCFSPPKPKKGPSFLQSLSFQGSQWTSRNRSSMFDGFGRLQGGSPVTKRTSSDLETIESGDSDFDDSSQSSSGSSSSSDVGVSHLKWMPSIAWREALQSSKHALSVDESQKSSGVNGQSRSATRSSKNFVSIQDCAELLPAKRSLAERYSLDNGAQYCLHNAAVARKLGELDLADVWDFVNLIINEEVPLERAKVGSKNESILLIARRTISPLWSKDSAIDLSYDLLTTKTKQSPEAGFTGAHIHLANDGLLMHCKSFTTKLTSVADFYTDLSTSNN